MVGAFMPVPWLAICKVRLRLRYSKTMEATAETPNNKPWLLVVDDSRVVRKTVLKILGPHFNLLEAEDGQVGWRTLRQDSRIDLVISDIQMPEMDGYSLICKVRAVEDPVLREMPIIVITSAEDEITRERAYACGANDFVLKPFNAEQLLKCVHTQLGVAQDSAATLTTTQTQTVSTPAAPVETVVVVADNRGGTIDDAVRHFGDGVEVLRGLKTAVIAPRALTLALRLLPLLKYCNVAFKLGMDKELAVFHQRLAAAHAKTQAPATDKAPADSGATMH